MTPFEYVMVVVSIIIGLAITTLLNGAVTALRADTKVRLGLLHGLWVMQILMLTVWLWALRWSGVARAEWSVGVVMAYLFIPIAYYAASALLFPPERAEVSLDEYFLENRRVFFGILILTDLAGYFGPYLFYGGVRPTGAEWPVTLGFIPIHAALAWTSNRSAHLAWVIFRTIGIVMGMVFGGGLSTIG